MKNFLPCKRPKAERLSLDTLRFSDNGNEIFFNGDMKILELFSVAAIGHHRRRDPATGSLQPKTEQAARADEVNRHTLRIIRTLRPRFFFIENPMGGLRKMDYMQGIQDFFTTTDYTD